MGSNRVCFLCSSLGLFLHWFFSMQPRPHLLAVAVRSWQKYHKGVCRLFSLLYGYFEVGTKPPEEKSDCATFLRARTHLCSSVLCCYPLCKLFT